MELRITQIRKSKAMTQKNLAELCGTTQQQIAKIENGNGDPQLSTLKRVSEALKCELKDLFYSKEEFISEIQNTVKANKVNLKKISIIELNSLCANSAGIPSLHPYWSLIQIKNNKVLRKENS